MERFIFRDTAKKRKRFVQLHMQRVENIVSGDAIDVSEIVGSGFVGGWASDHKNNGSSMGRTERGARRGLRDNCILVADQENESMFGWSKASSNKPVPEQVTSGRLEIERQGHVAYLEYTVAGKVLQLIHSEVPEALRGQGLSSELAHAALEWAREQGVKVDVICPSVAEYLKKHPEYADLVL
jgi:predicted GNAT family acetyltransferase